MGLEDKARVLAASETEETVDADAERNWWLARVDELYAKIGEWLEDLVAKELVKISRTRIRLSDEYFGVYGIDALVLTFGPAAIVLRPSGRLSEGGFGRIDIYRRGRRGDRPVMLILGGSKQHPEWTLWPSRDPRDEKTLDAESFEATVERLL